MTQIVSSSSRHGRNDRNAGYGSHPYDQQPGFGYVPVPEPAGPGRGRHATPLGQGFGQVVGWTLLGSIVPGTGLIAAGRRFAGWLALGVYVTIGLVLAIGFLTVDRERLVRIGASFLADPNKILIAAGLLLLLVIGWVGVVLSTLSATRRYSNMTGGQRVLAALLATALIAAVAVPSAMGAQDAWLANDAIRQVFQNGSGPLSNRSKAPDTTKADPWADVPRVNVLLMGGDSGKDRIGVRPDTMIVASIDTKTGNTTLFSLPRNLQRVPFPPGSRGARDYPNGFQCVDPKSGVNSECLLNALWTWGDSHPAYYPGDKNPGLTATTEGIEQALDLRIDQYVLLNLRGFEDFIDAIGGLDINIKQRLPIGGSSEHRVASAWLKPGQRHLNGYYSLWYARSRWSTSDFDRMQRQRCVIGAVIKQANPTTLALGFANIMRTLRKNVDTSIESKDIDAWVTLALRVKNAKVTSLAFTDAVINTVRPDYDKMHQLVKAAINPPPAPSTAPVTPTTPVKKNGKPVKPTTPAATGQADDLTAVC